MSGRICKNEGCTRPAQGRGMCKTHHQLWRCANPAIPTVHEISNQLVIDALPGTLREVAATTGLHVETVSAVLKRLNGRKGREVCIYDYRAPTKFGEQWKPLWKAGTGANYKLPESRRKAHAREVKQRTRPGYKAKVAAGMVAPAPVASWMDVLPVAA